MLAAATRSITTRAMADRPRLSAIWQSQASNNRGLSPIITCPLLLLLLLLLFLRLDLLSGAGAVPGAADAFAGEPQSVLAGTRPGNRAKDSVSPGDPASTSDRMWPFNAQHGTEGIVRHRRSPRTRQQRLVVTFLDVGFQKNQCVTCRGRPETGANLTT